MSLQELAQCFARLARKDFSRQAETVTALHALLRRGDSVRLLQLSLELTRLGDDGALACFDAVMNLLTCEPASLPGYPASQWRTYAMATVFDRPAGAILSLIANPIAAARAISEASGIPIDDIRVIDTQMPTDMAFDMGPADAYRFCNKLKLAVEVEANHVGSHRERVALSRRVAPVLAMDAVNGWAMPQTTPMLEETVFLVLVRSRPGFEVERHQLVGSVNARKVGFEASYVMDEGLVSDYSTFHNIIAFGPPWAVFRNALHVSQAFALARRVVATADEAGVPAGELRVSVTRVEDQAGDGYSTRAAIHHPERGLLAAVVEFDIAEPEQYVLVAHRLLAGTGGAQVQFSSSAYLSCEVDTPGKYRVLHPGEGWREAPQTFVAAMGS